MLRSPGKRVEIAVDRERREPLVFRWSTTGMLSYRVLGLCHHPCSPVFLGMSEVSISMVFMCTIHG
uniref:Uncharacterized protein LOC105116094 n=1 Tax=Rhizophora mucronata TaxID=61149 RepID=A0A2P2PIK7_RHIMU